MEKRMGHGVQSFWQLKGNGKTMTSIERRIRKLTELKINEPAVVAKIKLERNEAGRLDELGLHIGSAVRVLAGNLNESILIAVGDGRIGVNYDVAQKIYVY